MKKIMLIFVILLIFSCSKKLEGKDFNSNEVLTENIEVIENNLKPPIIYEEQSKIINRNYLNSFFYTMNLNKEEEYDIGVWGLQFLNNIYHFRPLKEGDPPYIEGSYEIIGNKILLKYIGIPYGDEYNDLFDDILKEDWELEYTIIDNSLYFSEGLIGKGITFGRNDSKPRNGDTRIINGHEIIIQGIGRISFNSNVIVRTGHGMNFQQCIFEWWDEWSNTSITEYLQEGYPFYILGRSKDIDINNGLTGYWYYGWIPVYPDSGGKIIEPSTLKTNSGWIFRTLSELS